MCGEVDEVEYGSEEVCCEGLKEDRNERISHKDVYSGTLMGVGVRSIYTRWRSGSVGGELGLQWLADGGRRQVSLCVLEKKNLRRKEAGDERLARVNVTTSGQSTAAR